MIEYPAQTEEELFDTIESMGVRSLEFGISKPWEWDVED